LFKKTTRLIKGFFEEFRPISGEYCKSKSRQITEVIQLMLRLQFTPDEYYTYGFYKIDKDYKYMMNYLSNFYSLEYYHPALIDPYWVFILSNKLLFKIYFSSFSLPIAESYGFFDVENGYTIQGNPLSKPIELEKLLLLRKPESLVIKPVSGEKGTNITIIDKIVYEGTKVTCKSEGKKDFTVEELTANLKKNTNIFSCPGYLLEEKLRQHDLLDIMNPSSINTFRIVTFLNKNHKAEVHLAYLRLGRADSQVDNASQGGLRVSVNIEEGILGEGSFLTRFGNGRHYKHPDTNITFTGVKIPFWEESIDLCCKAAGLFPFCRSIGWDVAIAPDGPVLVEGNSKWAIEGQLHSNGYLQPHIRESLAPYNLIFPEHSLPGINVRDLFKALIRWSNS
jgi:hypothetical protein